MTEDHIDPVIGGLKGVRRKGATATLFEHTIRARSVR